MQCVSTANSIGFITYIKQNSTQRNYYDVSWNMWLSIISAYLSVSPPSLCLSLSLSLCLSLGLSLFIFVFVSVRLSFALYPLSLSLCLWIAVNLRRYDYFGKKNKLNTIISSPFSNIVLSINHPPPPPLSLSLSQFLSLTLSSFLSFYIFSFLRLSFRSILAMLFVWFLLSFEWDKWLYLLRCF